MNKQALSDKILLTVEKPARYIGNEVNSVVKEPGNGVVRFAMCFPDVYEIGMSHLGIQILYDMFNRRDDCWCERVYSPWTDLDKIIADYSVIGGGYDNVANGLASVLTGFHCIIPEIQIFKRLF